MFYIGKSIALATTFAVLCLLAVSSNLVMPGTANAGQPSSPDPCSTVRSADFSATLDAPTTILSAKRVAGDGNLPGYCEINGKVAPSVEFLLRLPERWNGKFLELGCGGPCGVLTHIAGCDGPLSRGYACTVSDGGHKADNEHPMKWAEQNSQAVVEYLVRASHVTALAGQAITERYYGQRHKKSYFMGCSAGGLQAMWLAQNFPLDFDAIAAGGPCLRLASVWVSWLWNNRALMDANGDPLLKRADLEFIHRAVVSRCDMNDGVKDGLIGDPRMCAFEPAELRCTGSNSTACLTAEQVAALEKIYNGSVTADGKRIAAPVSAKGSELTWLEFFDGHSKKPTLAFNYFKVWHQYSIYPLKFDASWNPENFDFEHDPGRLGPMEALEPMHRPDLRRFKAAGRKLLAYTGWNDPVEGVLNTVDYYETVEKTMGGRAATQDFFRLFMVPGMDHCIGGDGASTIDWLGHLEDWVERGKAPDVIVGAHVRGENWDFSKMEDRREFIKRNQFPLDKKYVEFTRPVYPYPVNARYLGSGDPRWAESFGPKNP